MYPKAIWDQQVEPLLRGNILDEQTADLNVKFRMGKTESVLDGKQGRITLDTTLLEAAGIDREVKATRAGSYWRIEAA
jgi:DNA-binding transcriptional regulator/RsmH inhibitor MraZ